MGTSTGSAGGERHDLACAGRLRERALLEAGDPDPAPVELLHRIAVQISEHCGHRLLKSRRLAHGWTVQQAVEAVHSYRATHPGLPAVGLAIRSWKDWEAGGLPQPIYQDLLCRMFSTGPVQLGFATDYSREPPASTLAEADTNRRTALKLAGATALSGQAALEELLGHAAEEAMEFTQAAEATMIGSGTLQQLDAVVIEFDLAYALQPPALLFPALLDYRRKVQRLLGGPHTLRQATALYVAAGWLSELLAWTANDLGDSRTGAAFATDAFHHARESGHGELAAWAQDAAASIELYQHRPQRALDAAMSGLQHAPKDHPLNVRMQAQAARAFAAAGDRDGFIAALRAAHESYATLPTHTRDRFGAATLPLAEFALTSYPATANLWLGDHRQARSHAREAIAVYEAVPPELRSPSREAIARLDLALASAHLGDLGTTCEQATRALSSPRVVDSVRSRARDLHVHLRRHPTRDSGVAELLARLSDLTAA